MKNFFKWFTWTRIVAIICIFAGILLFVFSITALESRGKDYTEEYQVYLQVKGLTNSEDIRSKLQELKLEYNISSDSIAIDQCDYVSFTKRGDSWQIKSDTIMAGFEKLDKEDLNEVSITGEMTDNGTIKEVIECNYNGTFLTKIDNTYYANNLRAGFLIAPSIIFVFLGVIFITKSF